MDTSIVSSLGSSEYATLKYDQVEAFSADLLDRFMCFKALLRDLKAIIAGLDDFEPSKGDKSPIEVSLEVLLGVRRKIRQEMMKIIEAIEILSRDPWSHKRQMSRKQWQGPQPASDLAVVVMPAAAGPNAVGLDYEADEHSKTGGGAEQLTFDFGSLVSPDIWKHSMPISKSRAVQDAINTSRVAQSSKAMGREHKHEMDTSLDKHNSKVQEMTNALDDLKKTSSEKEVEFNNLKKTYSDREVEFNNLKNSLSNTKTDLVNVNSLLYQAQEKIRFAEGLNNLDPACHRRNVMICLRVIPHTALDFAGSSYILLVEP